MTANAHEPSDASDASGVDAHLADALAPPLPGRLVRVLGRVHGGLRDTGEQIVRYADHWRSEAERALTEDEAVLVALGDSLGQGIGASAPTLGYVGLLARAWGDDDGRPIRVLNLSRSGALINDVLEGQIPALAASGVTPHAVVCTVGSNDLVRGGRLRVARRHMSDLVAHLPDGTVLATLPDAGSLLAKALNRHVRSEAAVHAVPLADVAGRLTSWRGLGARDRFHPNDAGHRLWADAFLAASGSARQVR